MNNKIVIYYQDQIKFYTNRYKKIQNSIKDKERIGLPTTELDNLMLEIESENVKRFEDKLKQYQKEK